MSSSLLMEIAEAREPGGVERRARPVAGAPTEPPARDFEAAIQRLSRSFVDPDGGTIEGTIALALETLGLGLRAEVVDFFAADAIVGDGQTGTDGSAGGFDRADRWLAQPSTGPRSCSALPARLDLEAQPAVRDALTAGRIAYLPTGPTPAIGKAREGAKLLGWRRAHPVVLVPCVSPRGLLGVFGVAATAQAGSDRLATLDRAEHLGRLVGLALDRILLEGDVATLRQARAHQSRLETIGRMTSATAHDLNNILTAILGYGELLGFELDLKPGDRGHEDFAELCAAAHRAASVVDELLRFGRREHDGIETLDLGDAIASLSGIVRQVLGRGIECAVDPGPTPAPVRLDRGRLESALLNLAANARAAVGEGGHFDLSTRVVRIDEAGHDETVEADPIPGLRAGDHVRLTVWDDGCGIPADVLPRVFEPFFTTKAPGEGTGLGLASVAAFVKAAQGGLRVESAEGEGTAFHLYFPLQVDPRRT